MQSNERKRQAGKTDYRDSPVAWFAVLQRAVEQENCERAAEAQAELRRLGVRVAFDAAGATQ
jgi:hypothetical protein